MVGFVDDTYDGRRVVVVYYASNSVTLICCPTFSDSCVAARFRLTYRHSASRGPSAAATWPYIRLL